MRTEVDVQIGTKDRTGKGPKWQRTELDIHFGPW